MVDLLQILQDAIGNPVVYFLLVFVYAILVAIILPIPIEFALVFALGNLGLFTAALLAVGLGKAVGAWLIFLLGVKVEGAMTKWAQRARWIEKTLNALERFVRWTGELGLYILLSIPFMSDTVPIYFYALFNEEGKAIDQRGFIVSNFLAGINRVAIFFILALTILPGLIPP